MSPQIYAYNTFKDNFADKKINIDSNQICCYLFFNNSPYSLQFNSCIIFNMPNIMPNIMHIFIIYPRHIQGILVFKLSVIILNDNISYALIASTKDVSIH